MERKHLIKQDSLYRILSVYCDSRKDYVELDSIRFFNKNGVVTETDAYFDNFESFYFYGNVLLKRKEDFEIKDNYVMKYITEDRYILYINIDNIDLKYVGLEKNGYYIYRKYIVNDRVEFSSFVKSIADKVYLLKNKIEDNVKILSKMYDYPLEQTEIENLCNDIIKYNKELVIEEDRIKNYIPKEEDFK